MDDFSIYGGTFDFCSDNLAKGLYGCRSQLGLKLGKVIFYGTRRCGARACGFT